MCVCYPPIGTVRGDGSYNVCLLSSIGAIRGAGGYNLCLLSPIGAIGPTWGGL